jgi:hypothetical protein
MDAVTNHRYNVPAAGYYKVTGQITVASGGTGVSLYAAAYKNGSVVAQGTNEPSGGSANVTSIVSDAIQCNAGDYLELWVWSGVTALVVGASWNNYFSVIPLTQQSIASQITPVAARAYRSAALSMATNTWVKIPVDTLNFDTGSNMDVGTNHRFNCPVTGYYHVEGNIQAISAVQQVAIYKNGITIDIGGGTASSSGVNAVVSDVLFCNAGDYLELWGYTGGSSLTTADGTTSNYLAVAQISGPPGANLAAARAYRNAALSLTASTWTKVPLDTTSFDPNGYMDVATNHRYNVPAAGPYLVVANAALTMAGNTAYVAIYKNGVEVSQTSTVGASGAAVEPVITDIVQCNAGDYLELWVYSGATSLSTAGGLVNFLSVTPLVSAVTSTPGFGTSGSSSSATNVARAYRSAALTPANTGWQKVPIDTTVFDPAGSMDVATNHRYNVPVSGYYAVSANIAMSSSTSTDLVGIYKNGVVMATAGSSQTNQWGCAVEDVVQCNAGDYLELWCYGTGNAMYVGGGSALNFISIAQVQAPSGAGNANALPYGPSYQQGVINATDLQLSALSITTGSGQLAFTVGSASQLIGKDASGLLVPMSHASQAYAITPSTLPASTNSIVCGVEIDLNNQVYLAVGASVSGQLSTGIAIATNSPSVTPGRTRIADIGVYNNAGTYEFSNNSSTATQGTNWIDRRSWARGARWAQANGVTGSPTVASGSWTTIDTSTMQCRVECSGAPLTFKVTVQEGSTNQILFRVLIDGSTTVQCGQESGNSTVWGVQGYGEYDSIAPGSHLFTAQAYGGGSIALTNGAGIFVVEEMVRQNANNGTA